MNLAIDIGNTLVKAAVFENKQLVESFKAEKESASFLDSIFNNYPAINSVIIASTRSNNSSFESAINKRNVKLISFDHTVKIPIENLYQTPETLGCDRLAAVVGANSIYPENNVMIVDFGTAITIDLITKNCEFLGGNISPGAHTRFRSLNEYTSKLPLLSLTENLSLLGNTTSRAIENGVILGIIYEIEGYIERLGREYNDLKIIFTGGDANFFAKRLKNPIFATYDLVVYGLNRILDYNAD